MYYFSLSNFFLLAEREEGRLKNEIKRLNNEINELKERRNLYEVSISSDVVPVVS